MTEEAFGFICGTMDYLQEQAASSESDATLVLAGPGAGKTTMLAARARRLVAAGERPERVLCLTFSRKAANSMKEKVATPGVVVSTFHAFCFGVLRARPDLFGELANGIVDDAERAASLAQLLGEGADQRLDEIDVARERGAAEDLAKDFDAGLAAAGRVDFAGMAVRVVEACRHNDEFAKWVGASFSEVLVDEYQDVSPVQEELVRIFFEYGARIWAVGDDDQSLYEFRAADVRRILDFQKVFVGASVVATSANYRCSGAVVEAARNLIARNKVRAPKTIDGKSGVDGFVAIRGYIDEEAEAKAIVRGVRSLRNTGVAATEIAVLTRSNGLKQYLGRMLEPTGVALMTAHASKGLEWDYVFVAGCEDGIFPAVRAPLEEERRVFYVAMTRARIGVALSYAARRFSREAYRSSFLDETSVGEGCGPEYILDIGNAVAAPARKPAPWMKSGFGEQRTGDLLRAARNAQGGRPERSGTRWSAADDAGLEDLVVRRYAPGDIARLLKRNVPEVIARVSTRRLVTGGDVGRILFERSRERAG